MRDNTIIYEAADEKNGRHELGSRDLFWIAALAAGMIALSILLLLAVLLGQDIREWNGRIVVGAFFFMGGIIWGLLVLVNR